MARKFQFYRNNFRGELELCGAIKNNTGGHLKIMGTGKNSNMRGHTKFLGGVEKIEGARLSGGLLQRGVKDK